MAFTPPPAAPQRGDRTTFSNRVDAFLLWLVALIPQMNTFLSSITSLAAGGANSFAFAFDSATNEADPGTGRVRLNNATQNAATVMRVNAVAGNGGSVTAFLQALQSGTSNVKASVRLQRLGDVTSYLLFDITAVAVGPGYINLTMVPRASTSASPFAANDTLMLFFDPKGDRGDGGNTPTQAEMRAAIGILPEANGGTNAATFAQARVNLGVPPTSAVVMKGASNDSAGTIFSAGAVPAIAQIEPTNSGGAVGLSVSNAGNNGASAVMAFTRDGQFRVFVGLDTDNVFRIGSGSSSYRFWTESNFVPGQYARLDGAAFSGNISAPVVTQTSDERKKKNWCALTDAQLDALAAMSHVGTFDWIDGSGASVGGSAQEIQTIVPEAVHVDAEGGLTVNYGGLCFAMAQAALRRSMA